MKKPEQFEPDLVEFLEPLRRLPFVKAIEVEFESRTARDRGIDAEIRLKTQSSESRLAVEFKRSYIDTATLNAIIVQRTHIRDRFNLPLLLLARYVPSPSAEKLAQAGVNFVDAVGNMYLNLGEDRHVFVVGRKEPKRPLAELRTSAGMVQVLFALLADENAINASVRDLGNRAGVGRNTAALARRRFIETGKLVESPTGLRIVNRKALQEDFLAGYAHILRPNLWMGTFRPLKQTDDATLRSIRQWADRTKTTWAATDLSRSRRTGLISVFLTNSPENLELDLKLVAERNGPVTLLRSFGPVIYWRARSGVPVVHPLLHYAELLHQGDPGALETAEQIWKEHLAK